MHVKDTLISLLKVLLKDKNPFKAEADIGRMLEQIQNGPMEEWMWKKIIEKMYDPKDSEELERRLHVLQEEKRGQGSLRGKMGGPSIPVGNSAQI